MSFGATLAQMRDTLKLSQAALARRSGVAQSTISEIESRDGDPKLSTALKLMKGLEVRMLEMVTCETGLSLRPWTGCDHCYPLTWDEFANQLAVIRGRAQLIKERLQCYGKELPGSIDESLQIIIGAVDHLAVVAGSTRK